MFFIFGIISAKMNPLEMNSKQIGGFQLRIVERTPNKRLSSLGLGLNDFYYI